MHLLRLDQGEPAAELDLTTDQTRQVRDSKGILQTGLDSALVALGTRPSSETLEKISANLDVALFRARVDVLDVLQTRVDEGGKLAERGREGGEGWLRWARSGLGSEQVDWHEHKTYTHILETYGQLAQTRQT